MFNKNELLLVSGVVFKLWGARSTSPPSVLFLHHMHKYYNDTVHGLGSSMKVGGVGGIFSQRNDRVAASQLSGDRPRFMRFPRVYYPLP